MTLRPALELSDRSRIVVAGDWHGDARWARDVLEAAAAARVDLVIQVGDFGIGGFGMSGPSMVRQVDKACHKFGCRVVVVPGNHDDYDHLARRPFDEAGMIHLGRYIRAVPRPFRFEVGRRRFGALGGAVSVDREDRVEGVDWWPQEAPAWSDVQSLGTGPLDVLIGHDLPAEVRVTPGGYDIDAATLARAAEVRAMLSTAITQTRPQVVFGGHWHERLSHHYMLEDGTAVRCEALDMERTPGNAVVLDLISLSVSPLELHP
ncbi:metallophosphoesterase [Isoptericola sp. NPDC019571]|uniref:metallophosphoesterase family protein n=1 Tax=Isoptericola sp. NPDC019571 TaxID=3364008 RepID=UPI003796F151